MRVRSDATARQARRFGRMMRGRPSGMADAVVTLLDGRITLSEALLRRCSLASGRLFTFLGGSLIEGLGNASSDLDVYAVGDELPRFAEFEAGSFHRLLTYDRRILRSSDDPDTRVFIAHYSLGKSCMKVDVEFQELGQLLELADRVDELHAYAAANLVLLTKRLSVREENCVMRLLTGRPLTGEERFRAVQAKFDRARIQYLAYRWLASDFSNILDIIGAWHSGDVERCLDLARENLIRQMQAYLHLKGMFNLRRKWLLSFANSLLADELDLKERFANLFFFRAPVEPRQFIAATLDLVDEIFARSERLLVENGSAPTGKDALALLACDRELSGSRYADLEFEYRAKVYGLAGRPTRTFVEEAI
jgi:hypothetical protein